MPVQAGWQAAPEGVFIARKRHLLALQRTATHLSMVQSEAPDPAIVGRLSSLVAGGRAAVTSASGA